MRKFVIVTSYPVTVLTSKVKTRHDSWDGGCVFFWASQGNPPSPSQENPPCAGPWGAAVPTPSCRAHSCCRSKGRRRFFSHPVVHHVQVQPVGLSCPLFLIGTKWDNAKGMIRLNDTKVRPHGTSDHQGAQECPAAWGCESSTAGPCSWDSCLRALFNSLSPLYYLLQKIPILQWQQDCISLLISKPPDKFNNKTVVGMKIWEIKELLSSLLSISEWEFGSPWQTDETVNKHTYAFLGNLNSFRKTLLINEKPLIFLILLIWWNKLWFISSQRYSSNFQLTGK